MPRVTRRSFPALTRHASGQAKLRIGGRDYYFGVFGSPEAEARYLRVKAHYLIAGELPTDLAKPKRERTGTNTRRPGPPSVPSPAVFTVSDLCRRFLHHAEREYVRADGKPNAEYHCYRSALRVLDRVHGSTPVDAFGPKALREVREVMVSTVAEDGRRWTRTFINKSVGRIRHAFKWGVSHELVRPETLVALSTVTGLKAGKCDAPDNPKRTALNPDRIERVRAILPATYRDLVDLMLATAARPGELTALRTRMIDRGGDVWVAEIVAHKTRHHGYRRFLIFDAAARAVLAKYLRDDAPDARLFPINRETIGRNVREACVKAGVRPWVPHELRHTALTAIRSAAGADVAQVFAGHSKLAMTEHYARPDLTKAIDHAKSRG